MNFNNLNQELLGLVWLIPKWIVVGPCGIAWGRSQGRYGLGEWDMS
jgi:hypothetical protein